MTTVADGLFQYGGSPVASAYNTPLLNVNSKTWFVDGTNGADGNKGDSPKLALATIARAIALAGKGDTIFVFPQVMAQTDTDPTSYAETIIITQPHLSLVGVSHGRTQGGLPQMKKGAGSTAMITVRAPGVTIANMGINGASATGGGILLDDDGSTKTAWGTTIVNCHFKNCKGSSATNAATGGAIQWAATGGAWQVLIKDNKFYKNVGDVVLLGTSSDVPQDVVIEDNIFSGPAASVDCNLFLSGGSGMNGVYIRNNVFPAFPAVGSGTNVSFMVLTGCVGSLTGNHFGSNNKTFGAAGNVLVPTTMLLAANYQEKSTSGSGEIFRT